MSKSIEASIGAATQHPHIQFSKLLVIEATNDGSERESERSAIMESSSIEKEKKVSRRASIEATKRQILTTLASSK
jgi:hypothetical protein